MFSGQSRIGVAGRIRRLALAAVAFAALPGLAQAHDVRTPIVSGLPWRSGLTPCSTANDFAEWRGRKVDVIHFFASNGTWQGIADYLNGPRIRQAAKEAPLVSVSIPMMPRNVFKQFAACRRGDFDKYFREYANILKRVGAGNAVVRLGHEWNTSSDSRTYRVETKADISGYVGCFQREAKVLRQTAPQLKIEWTEAVRGKLDFNNLDAYPGDAAVDIWGVNFYDISPQYLTQKLWDDQYNRTRFGGPLGLGAWLKAAKARGKKLAVSEWAIWDYRDQRGPALTDNPLFIQNMYRFFRNNAADIAYETYYNCPTKHVLYPRSPYPKSSKVYDDLYTPRP